VEEEISKSAVEGSKRKTDLSYVVYIATNEKDKGSLRRLKEAGFKISSDLDIKNINSLDTFVIELQLMIDADYMLFFGYSLIKPFVFRLRDEL